MRAAAALLLLGMVTAVPEMRYFRSERPLENLPAQAGQACVALDADVFAQSAADLADLRLYRDNAEVPYAIHQASPVAASRGMIALLNKGVRAGQTVFDAELPDGHYSDVELAVVQHDFIATVEVAGSREQTGSAETRLGSYTVFDLSKQKLGRSTVLHLPESDFKYLHFRIAGPLKPDVVTGLSVLRLPVSQPRYVAVGQAAQGKQNGHKTVFEISLGGRVPVDRVVFAVAAQPAQFSRPVTIEVERSPNSPSDASTRYPSVETASGNLLRVHSEQNGHRIDEERVAVDAPRAEFDAPAKWTITIDNGDDAPLKIDSVRLEMLERDLCFDAAGGGSYTLYFGDPALTAPRYDFASLFVAQASAAKVTLGAQIANSAWQHRPDQRAFTERHPALLWVGLVLVVGLLAAIAFGSLKKTAASQS